MGHNSDGSAANAFVRPSVPPPLPPRPLLPLLRLAARLWPAPVVALAAACTNGGPESDGPGPAPGSGVAAAPVARPLLDPPDQQRRRERLVADFIQPAGVRDAAVLAALRQVPRHLFVPADRQAEAYDDHPLPIGHDQTISQPSLVAYMTELLAVGRDSRVLEIGTGSGYQAAILGELVREVFTIEIVRPLGEQAAALLARLGYANIRVRVGDGYQGWPEHAPFDAIIVTCAPERVPQPLVDQLKPGGRLCLPVGPRWGAQDLYLLVKRADGTLERRAVLPVRFVPMTGEARKQ
jgi:protein-L-isoaspartate(D-aspartate) O-methyltransferase